MDDAADAIYESDHPEETPSPSRPARRSVYALVALGIGFGLARYGPDVASHSWLTACGIGLCAAGVSRGWACRASLFACVVLLGAGWFTMRIRELPADSLARVIEPTSRRGDPMSEAVLLNLTARVLDEPRPLPPPASEFPSLSRFEPSWGFEAEVVRVENRPASGRLRVRITGVHGTGMSQSGQAGGTVSAGSLVNITGYVEPVRPAMNPGEPDRLAWAAQGGWVGTMRVQAAGIKPSDQHESISGRVRSEYLRSAGWLHGRAMRALGLADTDLPQSRQVGGTKSGALLGAMLLGQRDPGLDEVNEAFTRLGLLHLVAISGFNLAVMAGVAIFVLRAMGLRGRAEPIALAALVVGYMLILPAQAPILRSGIMVLAFLLADAAGRRYDRLTLLGWIACGLLLWRPLDLWSAGFQLSFGIVAVLLAWGRAVEDRLFGPVIRGTIPNYSEPRVYRVGRWWWARLRTLMSTSLLAWGVAAPVIACHTGMFSPLAPLTTLIVLPLTVIVLWLGYVALLVGVAAPTGAAAAVLDAASRLLVDVVLTIDDVPGLTVRLPRLSPWWAAGAVIVILYWFTRARVKDWRAWSATAVAAAWLGVQLYQGSHAPPGAALRIDTFAVGDGTCHLIRSGSDAMLWDCGSLRPGLGKRTIPAAVREVGGWRVTTALVTHANLDHFSALLDAAEPLGIREVLITRDFAESAAARPESEPAVLLARLRDRGIAVRIVGAGDSLQLGAATLTFLWPPKTGSPYPDANDSSLVGRISVATESGERAALFTGDIGPAAIGAVSGARTDILELPHHGSANEQAFGLVRAADPRVVLQSTGAVRARETAGRWRPFMTGREWFTTAADGAAWVEVRKDGTLRAGRSGSVARGE